MQLLLGRWYWCAFEFFVYFDVFTNFFFGLFIRFANTFGFTSGMGHSDQAHSNDCGPTNFDNCVHFLSFIKAIILACIALAQNGCGKFQPTNAPTAIHNMISNILRLLKFQGVVAVVVHQTQVQVLI
jgi:hypothetical protein